MPASRSFSSWPSAQLFKNTTASSTRGTPFQEAICENEVNDPFPNGADLEQDVDDLLTTIRIRGLDVVEGPHLLPHLGAEDSGTAEEPTPGEHLSE